MAAIPPRIAHYEIVRPLGQGGMGAVYLGRDPDLDRHVAIKVLREPLADDELLERFLREARATANLRHENLVTIYQVGEHEHQPFIAMEYVNGTTLAELVKRRQALPLAQKLSYIEQICAGLSYAHRVGIVHRDIKPANVMVDAEGVVRILDFGIARVANSGMTTDGTVMGTLNYMSPEQMLGQPVDYRSDIFSVGSLAYELLSYCQAFPGSPNDGLLPRLLHEDPAPLTQVCPGLPHDLEGIVIRALAKRPDDRYGNLDEMRLAVRNAHRGMDPHLEVETVLVPARGKPRPSTLPPSSDDRRGLLERRARQLTLLRDAARTALSRGDVNGATVACEDALTLDPDDREASRLLVEIQRAKELGDQESTSGGDRERTMRPTVAGADVTLLRKQDYPELAPEVAPTSTSASPSSTSQQPSRVSRRYVGAAAAALVVLAIGGGLLWTLRGDDEPSATPPTSSSGGSTPAASSTTASSAPVSAPIAPSSPTVPPSTTPQPLPTAPPTAAPAPSPAAGDPLAEPLNRIRQLVQAGDVAAALREIDSTGPSTDSRVTALARSAAQTALESMRAALAAARTQRAADLAPAAYASAEQAQRDAEEAAKRSDYARSGRQALAATYAYRQAESQARTAAAAATATTPAPSPASTAAAPTPAASSPPPVAPPPPRAETAPAPTPAAAAPSPATAARPSVLESERAGILRALGRYQDAYRARSVEDLRKIYPNLGREPGQTLQRQFNNCRSFDVSFGNMQFLVAPDDPTAATVNVRTSYQCTPKGGQHGQAYDSQDVFNLRKVQTEWVIDSMNALDSARRR